MTLPALLRLGIGLVVAVTMAGCTSSEPPPEDPAGPVNTSIPTPTASESGEAQLSWDTDQKRQAAVLADKAMRLFARPSVSAETWWRDLAPLMSPLGQRDYAYVDPRNIPVTKVTGRVTVLPVTDPGRVIAHIPTDAGLYSLTLTRTPESPSWLVERITPPEVDPHGPDEEISPSPVEGASA